MLSPLPLPNLNLDGFFLYYTILIRMYQLVSICVPLNLTMYPQ